MKDRIIQFLSAEKITPAEFADKIGVQRSSMSHILNGRNYPSAAFLQKMLQAYPSMNPRWLMIGDGTMNMESAAAASAAGTAASSAAATVSAASSAAATVPAASSAEAASAAGTVPDFISDKQESEIQTVLFPGQEAENPVYSAPEVKNIPLMTVPNGDPSDSGSRPPSESVLNQSFPSSVTSEEPEKVSSQPNQKSPGTQDPSNTKEIEQVLFFYKDKTFMIYRPS